MVPTEKKEKKLPNQYLQPATNHNNKKPISTNTSLNITWKILPSYHHINNEQCEINTKSFQTKSSMKQIV